MSSTKDQPSILEVEELDQAPKHTSAPEQTSISHSSGGKSPAPSSVPANGETDQPNSASIAETENTEIDGQPGDGPRESEPESSVRTRKQPPTLTLEHLSLSPNDTSKDGSQSLRVDTMAGYAPAPPTKDEPYLDPTPKTPLAPRSPVTTPLEYQNKELPEVPAEQQQMDLNGVPGQEGPQSEDSQSEIQTIMDQFTDETKRPGQEEIMSPRLGLADQFRAAQGHFPPRRSSLGPAAPEDVAVDPSRLVWRSRPASLLSHRSSSPPAVPPKSPPTGSGSRKHIEGESTLNSVSSSQAAVPPVPEPEPDQAFDFHRFLEQLRHRTADPVARFLRSFLAEFGKRQWMVHEQVKIISDFLAFITNKMAQCEVWRGVSEVEWDNAKEGMEKLVMNRLYSQTFSPAIPPPPPVPRNTSRSRRKEDSKLPVHGRRGQHQEDVERDEILAQKIRIYSWVREEHLDIPHLGANGQRFLTLAQQELLKIKGYRAPRDKVICIMNCCKVIFGFLRNSKSSDTSADSFIPLLIYVVLKANPEHLVSNVQYILRFRNQEKLGGEAGYYLSSLSGAIQFIESVDRTSLTVSDEEFEKNVEAAVSAIAERNQSSEETMLSEKSAADRTPRASSEAEPSARLRGSSSTRNSEENAAVSGLLRTIQKPLSTIGRIFSDEPEPPRTQILAYPQQIPAQSHTPPAPAQLGRPAGPAAQGQAPPAQNSTFDAQEAAARQASAEAAEARRIQRAEHDDVVETLSNMFPNLDKDIIDDVVRMKEGRVGLAVDACLALSAGS